jgi:hypothetical protein
MKILFLGSVLSMFSLVPYHLFAQPKNSPEKTDVTKRLFLDVHQLEPGVKFQDVAKAHAKDLAVEGKYNVELKKFWVDEKLGRVYCLASAPDAESLRSTHAEAHGLLPQHIYEVTDGTEEALKGKNNLFLDVHYLGAGKVTAADVAAAHKKDLEVEGKHKVHLINYWVDEKEGVVMCLAQAKDSTSLIETHKEAHGLIPASVSKVKQGQ